MPPPSAKEIPKWGTISNDVQKRLKKFADSPLRPAHYPAVSFTDDALELARKAYEKGVEKGDITTGNRGRLVLRLAQRAALDMRRRILKAPKGARISLSSPAPVAPAAGASAFRSAHWGQSRSPQTLERLIHNPALKSDGGLASAIMIKMRWWEGLKPSQVALKFYGSGSVPNVIQVCRTVRQDYEELSGELRRMS